MTYNATEIRSEAEATLREAMPLYAHANRLVTTTKPPREGSQRARILAALFGTVHNHPNARWAAPGELAR